jgi:hypothetical protein
LLEFKILEVVVIKDRREFLAKTVPACSLVCLGCTHALALDSDGEKHKFESDAELTLQQVFNFAYKRNAIPIFRALAKEIGEKELLEMLERASSDLALERGREQAKKVDKNDLRTFTDDFRQPKSRGQKLTLTFEIVEDTDQAFEMKITECIWATTFREADAADIGYAAVCHGDFAGARGFNSKLKMVRTKTLMEGHDCCNHRYLWQV